MSDPFGLEPLASGGYGLTEAPRIGRDGTVWFSDVTGGGVHRIAPGGEGGRGGARAPPRDRRPRPAP
ncbi:hypothetical protein GKE82_20090 [Conexibacter sp. W3-3-2]|uniref:hypothetical protein n=1 Tax=Conexibacter sp. W3-3-2 TaxID=2675227 RepID=UPI0012B81222|nr:hypothetical protein [Conexibacter sp. W3-3-2]MTD46525.1 hypothetical protein [Conexibacter sp. W3-3-2]